MLASTIQLALLQQSSGGEGAGFIGLVIYLGIVVLMIASMWKVFAKAGQPGWAAIIPIYNVIVLLQIAKRPIWWIILLLIPLVNLIIAFVVLFDVSKNFGKGIGMALLLFFLGIIGWPVLAFGDARYQG